jgi:hypothetical protein
MEPFSALGVASNIIQIADFSSRIISRGYELYKSADGRTEEHAMLDNAAENLTRLYNEMNRFDMANPHNLTEADRQILKLSKKSRKLS